MTKLYRITVIGGWTNVRDEDDRLVVYKSGKVYTKDELEHFNLMMGSKKYVGDLPGELAPNPTFEDIVVFCQSWIYFELNEIARDLHDRGVTWRALMKLRNTVESMPDMPIPPPRCNDVVTELKRWREWAERLVKQSKLVPVIPPADYGDYRNGPNGKLLTADECWELFGISNSVLSRSAKDDPSIRIKNPYGRGFIYRYDVVAQIANRKDGDD
jgi:hypothetical protein